MHHLNTSVKIIAMLDLSTSTLVLSHQMTRTFQVWLNT